MACSTVFKKGDFMENQLDGIKNDSFSKEGPTEREAEKRHYDHYYSLAKQGKLTEEDRKQWDLARERKNQGIIE